MSTTSNSSGWNRSTSTPKPAPKKPSAMRGVVAGLVVVAIAAACVVVFMGKGEKPVEKTEKERGRIKEVAPAKARTNRVEEVKQEVEEELSRLERNRRNPNLLHPGVGARVITNDAMRTWGQPKVFKYRSEREIAFLLTLEPGTPVIGERRYEGSKFERDLEAALNTPIEYDKNDPQETKELKMAVQQTKDYLKELQGKGEDICEVLEKSYREIQDLGIYFMNVKSELMKIRKDPNSQSSDMEDAVAAANILLERKGIAPIKVSEYTKVFLKNSQVKMDGSSAEDGEPVEK